MQGPAAGTLVARVLAAVRRNEAVGPDAVTLLAREYAAEGSEAAGEAVGVAVARVLAAVSDDPPWAPSPTEGRSDSASERAAWLALLVDIAGMSDDSRLHPAISALCDRTVEGWPSRARLATAMREVTAALRAAPVVRPALVAKVVDELERLVGCTYQPGRGLLARPGEREHGTAADHIQAAIALLTAHAVTGRLPYAMLADELIQFASRSWWGGDLRHAVTLEEVAERSEAARVLAHLAVVHAEPRYMETAVVTAGYDHVAEAGRLLAAAEPSPHGIHACVYALAVEEITRLKREE
ncbi:MAG: hypothetical protein AB7F99_07285 [Vicinamibacterales bacterium]